MPRDLISYLPPNLQNKVIYKEVCGAQNNQFTLLVENINYMANNMFLSDLTLEGVIRWEKRLKIVPKASETLEDRRFRILNRFLNKLPYTMRTLENTLNSLVGEGRYKKTYDNNTYTLTIKIDLTAKNQLDEVKRTLKYMVPANIVQDITLLYNNYGVVKKHTYGSLKKYTYKGIREEAL